MSITLDGWLCDVVADFLSACSIIQSMQVQALAGYCVGMLSNSLMLSCSFDALSLNSGTQEVWKLGWQSKRYFFDNARDIPQFCLYWQQKPMCKIFLKYSIIQGCHITTYILYTKLLRYRSHKNQLFIIFRSWMKVRHFQSLLFYCDM